MRGTAQCRFGRPGFREASAVPADAAQEIFAFPADIQPRAVVLFRRAGILGQGGDVLGHGLRQLRFAGFRKETAPAGRTSGWSEIRHGRRATCTTEQGFITMRHPSEVSETPS